MRRILIFTILLVLVACSPEEERPSKHEEPSDTTGTGGSGFRADTTWNDTIRIRF